MGKESEKVRTLAGEVKLKAGGTLQRFFTIRDHPSACLNAADVVLDS